MDEIDKKLIGLLSDNGRRNNNELAKVLHVSEGTVRNRIRKLTESGLLKVSAQINPEKIAGKELFFLGIKVAASKDLYQTAEKISRLEEVKAVHIITGQYDILAEVWVEVKTGMIRFLSEKLYQVSGVVSTESYMAMKTFNKWLPATNSEQDIKDD